MIDIGQSGDAESKTETVKNKTDWTEISQIPNKKQLHFAVTKKKTLYVKNVKITKWTMKAI